MSEAFLRAIFADNLALTWFLGIGTVLATNIRLREALAAGLAVIVLLCFTVPLNHLLYRFLLAPGAWEDFGDLSFLRFLMFAGSILIAVELLELVLARHAPGRRSWPDVVRLNSALFGASLFMAERDLDLVDSLVYGAGAGIGWALAVAAFVALRERMSYSEMAAGPGAGFFLAGLLSMAFLALGRVLTP